MTPAELRQLRRASFGAATDDPSLAVAVDGVPGHDFLQNAPSRIVYGYLTRFISESAQLWFVRDAPRIRVLDWGAGRGQVSYLLERLDLAVVSTDVEVREDPSQVPLLRDREVIPLTHPWRLPFADGEFDVVLSVGVLEHVPDDRASLRELHRVTAPGGLLYVFNLPAITSWSQRVARARGDHYHDRLYGLRTAHRMVDEAGWSVLDSWRRQLFPKNAIRLPMPLALERVDQALTRWSPLRVFATSIELVATKS